MKNIFNTSFLAVITILLNSNVQAQMPDKKAMEKIKAMQKMYSGTSKTGPGKITYSINNKTYSYSDGISTVIIDGKIGDISDDQHNAVIGDGMPHAFKIGQPYICNGLIAKVDGMQYSRRSKNNKVTILSYNGKVIKGIFSGTVYNEKTKKTLPIKGSFETGNITSL